MKKEQVKVTSGGGISFVGLLTIAFIVLKLLNVINWSWIWVLSPLWIGPCLVILILFLLGIYALCAINKDE